MGHEADSRSVVSQRACLGRRAATGHGVCLGEGDAAAADLWTPPASPREQPRPETGSDGRLCRGAYTNLQGSAIP